MADFQQALSLVLRHEGGYSNHPCDPGGATNYGITKAVYAAWAKKDVTDTDVKQMPIATASVIYHTAYWGGMMGDAIQSQGVANHLLDMCVLRGVAAGVRTMQQVLGIKADGELGKRTLAALNAAQPAVFLNDFRSVCVLAFAEIVMKRPASLVFLHNWLHRAEDMSLTVSELLRRMSVPAQSEGVAPVA